MGAHRQRLAHRLGPARGSHRDDRHLAAVGLDELERRFEGVLVVGVDDGRRRSPIEASVGPETFAAGGGIGHRLDEDDDLHVGMDLLTSGRGRGQ